MQIVLVICATLLSFGGMLIVGIHYKSCFKDDKDETGVFVQGVLLYYALFQLIAFPMIVTFQKLSRLSAVWSGMIGIAVVLAVFFRKKMLTKELTKFTSNMKREWKNPYFLIMILTILLELCFSLLQCYNAWDTAFYIPTVNAAVDTDTMYVYNGTSGWKQSALEMRYAMSAFYMYDAVLAKSFGISGAVVCRYYNTVLCHLCAAFIVYRIGMLLYHNQKKTSYLFVFLWTLANFGVHSVYLPNAFLMERAYEAKASCSNIIIPALIYYLMRVHECPEEKKRWIDLFVLNVASVGISASSLALVPLVNGCMMLGHLFLSKRMKDFYKCALCLFPCIVYLVFYLFCRKGLFVIQIP